MMGTPPPRPLRRRRELLDRPHNHNLEIVIRPHKPFNLDVWIEELMLNIGRGFLHLIGWKPQLQRVYEQLERLSPDWPQISDEAIAAIESLSDAFIASQIATRAAHHEMEPYQPQPEYEQMQFAQADWTPE